MRGFPRCIPPRRPHRYAFGSAPGAPWPQILDLGKNNFSPKVILRRYLLAGRRSFSVFKFLVLCDNSGMLIGFQISGLDLLNNPEYTEPRHIRITTQIHAQPGSKKGGNQCKQLQ